MIETSAIELVWETSNNGDCIEARQGALRSTADDVSDIADQWFEQIPPRNFPEVPKNVGKIVQQ